MFNNIYIVRLKNFRQWHYEFRNAKALTLYITLHYIKFRVKKCICTSVTLQVTENLKIKVSYGKDAYRPITLCKNLRVMFLCLRSRTPHGGLYTQRHRELKSWGQEVAIFPETATNFRQSVIKMINFILR